jgi:hypothetical protein
VNGKAIKLTGKQDTKSPKQLGGYLSHKRHQRKQLTNWQDQVISCFSTWQANDI